MMISAPSLSFVIVVLVVVLSSVDVDTVVVVVVVVTTVDVLLNDSPATIAWSSLSALSAALVVVVVLVVLVVVVADIVVDIDAVVVVVVKVLLGRCRISSPRFLTSANCAALTHSSPCSPPPPPPPLSLKRESALLSASSKTYGFGFPELTKFFSSRNATVSSRRLFPPTGSIPSASSRELKAKPNSSSYSPRSPAVRSNS
mmetsp:Transcript_45911/g.73282  ORF Transcript_45911/g.73282 Transcript_45911/m.73282 type:complete len:201 (-) Transcript_45911:467-1069(-)